MSGLANEIDPAIQLAPPPIADDAGVPLAPHHLQFVGLDAQAVADWRARRAPLGMTPVVYRDFCGTFFAAVQADGVPDIDARLKGSAVVVYSGRHKALPQGWGDHVAAFSLAHGHQPTAAEEADLRERFDRLWRHRSMPMRRPFDSMFHLNLDLDRSDYDVQVSSGDIEQRCIRLAGAINAQRSSPGMPVYNAKYGFLNPVLVDLAVTAIARWTNQWTATLGRTVALKAFGATGPANTTGLVGHLSSHFRAEDWMLRPARPGID